MESPPTVNLSPQPPAVTITQVPSFSIFSYFTNLPFSLKVFFLSLFMLFLHYIYTFIKNKFFSKKVSFDEDNDLIEHANNLDDDESITDSVKIQMENDLKNTLNIDDSDN
jgi:hypothetical protein